MCDDWMWGLILTAERRDRILARKLRLPRSPRVAIAGAGFGGIAMAVKLKQAGFDFTVFEMSPGPGGVWWDNTYPGCEVDAESSLYSFSFIDYDWPRTHGTRRDLQQYCEDIIDHFEMRRNFRFSTQVEAAVWDETKSAYTLRLSDGEECVYELFASAVGMLNVPKYPDWPGFTDYEGPMFHSARWEHEHDLTGKRIAVVGTGCTAAQIVPEVAKLAKHVYVFQREPGWILPKDKYEFTPEERAYKLKHPWLTKWKRWKGFRQMTRYLTGFTVGSKHHQKLEQTCLNFIESSIDDPNIRRLVTPNYPYGCKRPIKDSNFYPALNRPNVELVPKAVARLTRTSLVDADGVEREADIVVLAVGFKASDYLANLPVVGERGRALRDVWDGDPKAYLGLTVPGFPNFFMLYGPNTNGGGPITAQHERQAEAITRVARRMRRGGFARVDTKQGSLDSFVEWIDRHNGVKWSALASGCHNYYFSRAGRNVTQWPLSHLRYMAMTRIGIRTAMTLRRGTDSAR